MSIGLPAALLLFAGIVAAILAVMESRKNNGLSDEEIDISTDPKVRYHHKRSQTYFLVALGFFAAFLLLVGYYREDFTALVTEFRDFLYGLSL